MRLRIVLICLLVLCHVCIAKPAHANTLISATIAPVRIVTVTTSGEVTRIDSNTNSNIAPTWRLESGKSLFRPTSRSQAKYEKIIRTIPSNSYGTIYQRPDTIRARLQNFLTKLLRARPTIT